MVYVFHTKNCIDLGRLMNTHTRLCKQLRYKTKKLKTRSGVNIYKK